MDNSLIEKYKKELLDMYKNRTPEVKAVAANTSSNNGSLIVNVTTLRGLYPVRNALVSVFTGEYENKTEVDRSVTDQSGKSKIFSLTAPERDLSLSAGSTEPVYTNYGIEVTADGYAKEINLNLPIFSGVTSLQNVDMTLLSAQNGNGENMNDQSENYNL
ncbi:MAG: hypothetical protein E7561_02615 [Ruminococcaceae bacterium]|nr:hypothetical protein [Oscillospiraceae bacterium]